jgi:hypothetical protein
MSLLQWTDYRNPALLSAKRVGKEWNEMSYWQRVDGRPLYGKLE